MKIRNFVAFALLIFTAMIFSSCGECSKQKTEKSSVQQQPPEKKEINVFCSCDDGNAMPTCTTTASLLKNTDKSKKIILHIVYFDGKCMSEDNKNSFESLKKIRDFELNFVPFDEHILDNLHTEGWHKGIFIKLFACEIFKGLDEILWLDDDVIVKNDLSHLWDIDLEGKYLAGVNPAKYYEKYRDSKDIQPKNPTDYWITAGILLLNLKEIRKENVLEKFLKACNEFQNNTKKIRSENDILGGIEEYAMTIACPPCKFKSLEQRYSIMTYMAKAGRDPDGFLKEAAKEIENAKVLHFAGCAKPWGDKKARSEIYPVFLKEWDKYYEMTPYYDKDNNEHN